MSEHSKACCSIPPVVANGYEAKGSYSQVAGMKTYITGPGDAKKAILYVYDIFGFCDQCLQGADILAKTHMVIMPDLFDGAPAQLSWFAPGSEDGQAKLGKFIKSMAAPPLHLERIAKVMEEITASKGVTEWGAVGMCWGGKVVTLGSGAGTKWKAAAQCHPAMLDPKEAEDISIPYATLASKDEDKDTVVAFGKASKAETIVEIFEDQIHGWMAARANLEDEKVKSEYARGYKILNDFFASYL
ncbi:alpha hydrolase-6 [Coleophoma cylindrospora]|uniref:Alpha hydrolase-6 n=1 Tax=Coleophoma cylindrospora TaxID=1849047 RepID=A0A3D8SEV2_9HELO|nr:alpha hydrolase-6 [Coleophoma cylindrospora]